MGGKGCKYFFKGQCRKLHVDTLDGVDYLQPNFCHRYARGSCGDQFFCKHLHATDYADGTQKILEFAEKSGITLKPQQHITPLAQAVMSATESTPENQRPLFTENVLHVLESSSALQHPKIRDYLDIVCREIRDSTH
jgi:hypothetical protein